MKVTAVSLRGLLLALVLMSGVLAVAIQPASAAINQQINFQGKLTNPDGTNVTNGTFSIRFRVYNHATNDAANSCAANSCLWEETQGSVSVTDGIFQVALGSVNTALASSVDFNVSGLYLGIKVGADAEMTPRVQFTAAPYAFNSEKLGGITSAGFAQIGVAAAQTDASTNTALFLNKTSTGNQLQLQSSGVDVFTVANNGNLTLGQNAAKTISVAQTSTNAAGQALTVVAGQGGAGASANAGGQLNLQGGAGGGTNGAGGSLLLAGGAGSGSGASGTVVVRNPAAAALAFQVQDAASASLFTVDTTARSGSGGNLVKIGNSTGTDTATTILQLDAATAVPTSNLSALNGGLFYNSTTNKVSIIENGTVKVLCNATDLGCGAGGGTTLAAAYTASTNPEITLDATRGALTVRDNATPIAANLFEIQNNGGATTYFGVTASSATLSSGMNLTLATGSTSSYISNAQTSSSSSGQAFGLNATTANFAVAFGTGANVSNDGVAIGYNASTSSPAGIAIGREAAAAGNQFVAGSNAAPITDVYFGSGVTDSTSPSSVTFNATGASGSNIAGANFNLAGGRSTGTGNGGNINFQITTPGGAGATLNPLTTVMTFSGVDGSALIKNAINSAAAFEIQNSTGTDLFTVDAVNNRIYVGNATADAVGVLLVLDSKNTSGDPTGVDGGSYYNSNNRRSRCYENGAWGDCRGVSTPNSRRTTQLIYPGSGTAFHLFGDIATVGTAGTAIAATTTEPGFLNSATTATANAINHISGNTQYDTDDRIRYQTRATLTPITVVRSWLGVTNQTAATMAAGSNPAGHYAAFRFDTSVADANYMCVTKNNVSQTITSSGIAPVAGTSRKFEIMQSATEAVFFIDGARVCTTTTTLPAANTLLRYVNTVTTLEAVIKNLRTSWIYLETD